MKYVISLGFTCSLLYAKMEKPFNPILGETLQCSFKGSPMYMEQVSHHPPIAAFYMVGRGYRFYGRDYLMQGALSPRWISPLIAVPATMLVISLSSSIMAHK
jgi:hypothetical protein